VTAIWNRNRKGPERVAENCGKGACDTKLTNESKKQVRKCIEK
jgi:hypothetical protein